MHLILQNLWNKKINQIQKKTLPYFLSFQRILIVIYKLSISILKDLIDLIFH